MASNPGLPSGALLPGANAVTVFASRDDLTGDTRLKLELLTCSRLDMIALSAEVLLSYTETIFAALRRDDFSCRLVLYDPRPDNSYLYEPLVERVLRQDSGRKRGQAADIVKMSQEHANMQIRYLSKVPLQYNLWITSTQSGGDLVGHISVYAYDFKRGGPAFRVTDTNSPLLTQLRREFEFVWNPNNGISESVA